MFAVAIVCVISVPEDVVSRVATRTSSARTRHGVSYGQSLRP